MRFSAGLSLTLVLLAVPAVAAPPGLAPHDGLLVLRSGEVLAGQVVLVGEQYRVTVPQGELRIAAADVDFFCRDLDEAYRALRGRANPGEAASHLKLADWCLRQGLTGYAAAELAEAIAADPGHPAIAGTAARLRLATAGPSPTAAAPAAGPSAEELDRLINSLSDEAVATFTTTVQPLLLNHCGSVTCHGGGADNGLRLHRPAAHRPPTRRVTQRNLFAVRRHVDGADPAASPLLAAATGPHGGAALPLGDPQGAKVRLLAVWLNSLAGPAAAGDPPQPRGAPLPAQSVSATIATSGGDESPPGAAQGPRQRPPQPDAPASAPDRPAEDPFDPEPFNRRFFPPPRT